MTKVEDRPDPEERQKALNDLYAAYSREGDDDMNARCRVIDDSIELTGVAATEDELDQAQASFADPNDLEDLFS